MLLGLAAGFWSFRSGMSPAVQLIFAIGLVVVAVLAIGLFIVRNFGGGSFVRLPLPHRVVEFYDRFEEGVFSIEPRRIPLLAVVTVADLDDRGAAPLLRHPGARLSTTSIGISGAFFVALIASLLTAVPFTPAGLGLVEGGVVGILDRPVRRAADTRRSRSRSSTGRSASSRSSSSAASPTSLSPKTKGRARTPAEVAEPTAAPDVGRPWRNQHAGADAARSGRSRPRAGV